MDDRISRLLALARGAGLHEWGNDETDRLARLMRLDKTTESQDVKQDADLNPTVDHDAHRSSVT